MCTAALSYPSFSISLLLRYLKRKRSITPKTTRSGAGQKRDLHKNKTSNIRYSYAQKINIRYMEHNIYPSHSYNTFTTPDMC